MKMIIKYKIWKTKIGVQLSAISRIKAFCAIKVFKALIFKKP